MQKPTLSDTEAVHQAGDTMVAYVSQAITAIDNRLGPGYAAKHPDLIGQLVHAQTLDFNNASRTAAFYELVEVLRGIIERIPELADSITGVSAAIEEVANEIEDGLKNIGGSL
jgi:hypothetical protein